jgi:hypothetical protein
MSALQLRQRIKKQVDELKPAELRSAADFISKLRVRRKLSADDVRKIARMKRIIRQAERDFAAGRGVSVENLKRKY